MRSERWAGSAAAVCRALGGVARREQLIRAGVDDRMLRHAVRGGGLERVRPGTYADPDLPAPIRIALRHGGVLACVSVLRMRGLWVMPLAEIVHVSLPPNGHARRHPGCACIQHWNALECTTTEVSPVDALLQEISCQWLAEGGRIRRGTGQETEKPRLLQLRAVVSPKDRHVRRIDDPIRRVAVCANAVCSVHGVADERRVKRAGAAQRFLLRPCSGQKAAARLHAVREVQRQRIHSAVCQPSRSSQRRLVRNLDSGFDETRAAVV